jgi:hypothetical protein
VKAALSTRGKKERLKTKVTAFMRVPWVGTSSARYNSRSWGRRDEGASLLRNFGTRQRTAWLPYSAYGACRGVFSNFYASDSAFLYFFSKIATCKHYQTSRGSLKIRKIEIKRAFNEKLLFFSIMLC